MAGHQANRIVCSIFLRPASSSLVSTFHEAGGGNAWLWRRRWKEAGQRCFSFARTLFLLTISASWHTVVLFPLFSDTLPDSFPNRSRDRSAYCCNMRYVLLFNINHIHTNTSRRLSEAVKAPSTEAFVRHAITPKHAPHTEFHPPQTHHDALHSNCSCSPFRMSVPLRYRSPAELSFALP